VVGERHCIHTQFLHALDQRRYATGAVKERILAVNMEVDERTHYSLMILPAAAL
jgi:hypothetical protein